jgi:serine/threonine protein kinase
MADADWVKYKQIRGKPLPESAEVLGAWYRLGALLKRDFYAVTGVYDRLDDRDDGPPRRVLLKVYHTDPLGLLPLGALGRWLCRRESCRLRQVAGVAGVPQLLALHGESGLVREYVPGCNLRQYARSGGLVDEAFFPRLRAILDDVHARGLSHNDLSKPENVLVTPDGRPALIDFQISTGVADRGGPVVRGLTRRFVAYMQSVDHYHLTKLHTYRRPFDFTDEERAAVKRKGALLTAHGWVRRPYRKVRHAVLQRFLTAAPAADPAVPSPRALGRRATARQPEGRVGVAEDRPAG